MGEKSNSVFGPLILLLSDVAIIDAVYMMIWADDLSTASGIGLVPWLTMTAATFVLYRLFLRRERTLPQATVFLAVAFLATFVLLLVFFVRPPSLILSVITILLWSIPFWRIYFLTETPPPLERFISRFAAITFVLLLVLIYVAGTGKSYIVILPCASSMFLCLAALIAVRTAGSGADGSRGIRGAGVILAFLLFVGAIIAVFLLFAAASFGATVAAGAAALWRGVQYLGDAVLKFLNWIILLLPMPKSGEPPEVDHAQFSDGMAYEGENLTFFGETLQLIVICIIAALIATAVILIVAHFRHKKLGGKRIKKTADVSRFKLRLRPAFSKRFFSAVRFFIDSILYRNTPQGVFLQLERWGKLRRRGRALGETPRNYLKRISGDVPQQREALAKLADALDAHWYGDPGDAQMEVGELVALRKNFF